MRNEGSGSEAGLPLAPAVRVLSNVQILRGIAALMVLVYHIGNDLSDHGFTIDTSLTWVGSGGVDIFFVISGFIMVYSTADAFGRSAAAPLFLLRRIIRLVPLYYLVTTLFVLGLIHDAGRAGLSAGTWRWIAASYGFLFYPHAPDDDFPVYTQGWTLNFEMFFYLAFAAVLPLRRRPAIVTLATGFLLLTAAGLVLRLPWPLDRFSNTNIVQFVLGMLLAEGHRRGWRLGRGPALAIALAGFAIMEATIWSVDAWLPERGFVWGPPALMIVAAAALHEPRNGSLVRTWLERLGDASYSLYLVHFAVFVVVGHLLSSRFAITALPPFAYAGLLFLCAMGAAALTYRYVERPMTRALDRHFGLSRRWREVLSPVRLPVSSSIR